VRILFRRHQGRRRCIASRKRSAQYFVNSRCSRTLTNWKTISGSIKRLRHLDEVLNSGDATPTPRRNG